MYYSTYQIKYHLYKKKIYDIVLDDIWLWDADTSDQKTAALSEAMLIKLSPVRLA